MPLNGSSHHYRDALMPLNGSSRHYPSRPLPRSQHLAQAVHRPLGLHEGQRSLVPRRVKAGHAIPQDDGVVALVHAVRGRPQHTAIRQAAAEQQVVDSTPLMVRTAIPPSSGMQLCPDDRLLARIVNPSLSTLGICAGFVLQCAPSYDTASVVPLSGSPQSIAAALGAERRLTLMVRTDYLVRKGVV